MKNNVRAWLIVCTSFLIMSVIFATCISCMGVYVKPVAADLGISRTAFSLTITIGSFSMMLSSIAAGKMISKWNIKLMMLIGVLCCAGSMFLYSIAESVLLFYCSAVIMGISVSLTCNIPISALIKEWFDKGRQGLAIGVAFAGSGAGAMVLNPLYTYMIEKNGWQHSFQLAAIMMIVLLVPMVLLFVERRSKGFAAERKDPLEEENGNRITLSISLTMTSTWLVFIAFILINLTNMSIVNHGIPFLTDAGFSGIYAARIISIGSGLLILGKIVLGKMIDRIGIYSSTITGVSLFLICILALWCGGMMHLKMLLILFTLLYAIGGAVATVAMPCVVMHMFGDCDFEAIMGFFTMAAGLGGILQIVFSFIYDNTSSYSYAWLLIAALITAAIVMMVKNVKPQTHVN
ncbi:MAG: MFS transporter [Firmicutes bacterium]|nr:MFS transporter [Bacillota bacterium]